MTTPGRKAWDDTRYIPGVALEFFKAAGKPEKVAAGKAFFGENEKARPLLFMRDKMYLLLDGEVELVARRKTIGTVQKGQIFGEMASIDQGPRTGTALARSACRVIALDDRQLRAALGRYPEFALMLMSVMINRLRESIGRIGSGLPAARTKWMRPAPLRKDLIEDLARVLGPEANLSYDTGNTIVREGQVGVLMYVVLKGKVGIRAGETLLETVGPGGIFGEMALVDRTPRLASALAETNVRLLAINRAAFLNLVKHSRRFAASLLAAVSARARYAASR